MRMPAHVTVDHRTDTMRCSLCRIADQIPMRVRNNPETRLEFVELWALRHSVCAAATRKYVM